MKKRNAFTLIELLAVIVILAVIALITTTVIIKVVENARKNASKNSALNYLDAVEKYIMYHDVDSEKYPIDLKDNTWNITETSTKEISLLNIIPSVKAEEVEVPPLNDFIKVNGSKPTNGTITIDAKGKITNAIMVINNYNVTCDSSTNCSVEGKDTDPTPVLTIGNVTSASDTITISYTLKIEKGSATVECVYGMDENYGQIGTVNEENNTCTLSNLSMGTTYYFKLTPKSDKNKKGKSQTSSKETASYVSATNFKVGDYVYMVPSYVGSYTPTTDSSSPYYTGTSSPGSITPSELRRWVVIKNDGTNIEMVSESVSSTTITFYGSVGYENYVGALNKIAEQYENSTYTNGSRYFGYYNQILKCSSYAADDCRDRIGHNADTGVSDLLPETPSRDGIIYEAFSIARSEFIEPLLAYRVDVSTYKSSNTATAYWNSSRLRDGSNNGYHGTIIGSDGVPSYTEYNLFNSAGVNIRNETFAIRPILKLKSDVVADASGDGSSEHPWVLVEQ